MARLRAEQKIKSRSDARASAVDSALFFRPSFDQRSGATPMDASKTGEAPNWINTGRSKRIVVDDDGNAHNARISREHKTVGAISSRRASAHRALHTNDETSAGRDLFCRDRPAANNGRALTSVVGPASSSPITRIERIWSAAARAPSLPPTRWRRSERRWDGRQQRGDPSTPAQARRRRLSFFVCAPFFLLLLTAPYWRGGGLLSASRGGSVDDGGAALSSHGGHGHRRRDDNDDDIRSRCRLVSAACCCVFYERAAPAPRLTNGRSRSPPCWLSSRVTTAAALRRIHGATDHEWRSACFVASPLSAPPFPSAHVPASTSAVANRSVSTCALSLSYLNGDSYFCATTQLRCSP
uniref:Uncharacterized protein n=1 Tax=Plectus sambesii TaxID=2011161 RepID=A0A914W1X7_9BILA